MKPYFVQQHFCIPAAKRLPYVLPYSLPKCFESARQPCQTPSTAREMWPLLTRNPSAHCKSYAAVVNRKWTRPLCAKPDTKASDEALISLYRHTTTQQSALTQKQQQLGREAARAANALWCVLNENHSFKWCGNGLLIRWKRRKRKKHKFSTKGLLFVLRLYYKYETATFFLHSTVPLHRKVNTS